MKTIYLQLESDVRELMENGYCDICLRPAREWAEPDRFGGIEVHIIEDAGGCLVGFLCPECAAKEEVLHAKRG